MYILAPAHIGAKMPKAASRKSLKIIQIPLVDLTPDPENPRVHDVRNMRAIERSLAEHGQVEPLVVQHSTNMVIGGNGRMNAMVHLGWETADCVVLKVDDAQARRMSIALNRSGELAEWDMNILATHLDELAGDGDFDPDDLGFSDEEYLKLVAEFGNVGLDDADLDTAGESGGPTTAGNQETIPAGTQPGHLPSSHVRMIQLFFNEDTEPQVRIWAKRLSEVYGTDNLTDTIYECMERVARRRGWVGDGGDTDDDEA